ncbi:MAG TPA: aminotransferase class III-fold pyridoxal phosphate-dependent enzyme [Anaerolineae bacterium]|nr:aminotransferase class III-fold pyridoxal phosphate-dependent enzyme [Anaerolineae bacterium]
MSEEATSLIWYPGHELLLPNIVRAENCHLFDAAGRRYVDLESGVWCTSIGHGHPRIQRVMAEGAARISHTGFCYGNGIVEEAAREILNLLGFEGGKCVFLCSGSEAVEFSVRSAQAVIGAPLLLTMADSYFGAYGSASKKREDEWFSFDWTPCASCPEGETCGSQCSHWAAIPWARSGGLLFEPGSSGGLVRFPPLKLMASLADAVRGNGGLVLVNEVTTGIGRTGTWFGYQHYGFTPDVVALGKGLGNGYPVSVAAFAPAAVDRLRDRPLKYSQSHQNDPLGAAIAREVIRVIREEGLIERSQELAVTLLRGLERVRERTGRIREIRARGLMLAIELEDDPAASLTIWTHRKLVRRGFVVGRRPGTNVLRLDPSLTIEVQDLDGFVVALEEILVHAGEAPNRHGALDKQE